LKRDPFSIVAGDESIQASPECTQKRHKYVYERDLQKRPMYLKRDPLSIVAGDE